jgi:hypothetical protein
VRAGLNGSDIAVSLESVNYPGHFLRHHSCRLRQRRQRAVPERCKLPLQRRWGAGRERRRQLRVRQSSRAFHPPHELPAVAGAQRRHTTVRPGRELATRARPHVHLESAATPATNR